MEHEDKFTSYTLTWLFLDVFSILKGACATSIVYTGSPNIKYLALVNKS